MKEIFYFDLDGTLWQTSARIWIIDKMNPDKPLIKIDAHEFNLIYKGYYINDGNRIYYNGFEGWLSNELLTKIKKKKPLEIDRIGLSMREFTIIDFILSQEKDLVFHLDRLKNEKCSNITLLTARGNKKGHIPLINKLEKALKEIDVTLDDSIFVNDIEELKYKNTSDNSLKKLIKLIQSLVGFQIIENKFVPIICEEYDIVNFYDDEDRNIEICNEVNEMIISYYNNSDSIIKKRIKDKKLDNKILKVNLVTSNNLNPFSTKEIIIKNMPV